MQQPVRKELFGGAIECLLPERFIDISQFRDVPNNQEVLADANTDQSVIVEVIEHDAAIADNAAAKYFFDDLSEANDAKSAHIVENGVLTEAQMPNLPGNIVKLYAWGSQEVSKHRESSAAANQIHIYLIALRMPHMTSDILISFNIPVAVSALSSSHGVQPTSQPENLELVHTMLRSFKVNNWGLFTGEGMEAQEDDVEM